MGANDRRLLPVKRITIPDADTFVAAIQDEISRTREGRYFHRLDCWQSAKVRHFGTEHIMVRRGVSAP